MSNNSSLGRETKIDNQFHFPDLGELTSGLRDLLSNYTFPINQFKIVNRQPNLYASTFGSEIVTCHINGTDEARLFCKYGFGYQMIS